MLGVGALALCLYLWKEFIPAHQVWLACFLSQLGLFLLLASRFWQRGIEAALVLSADPPIVVAEEAAEEMDALEEGVPVAAGVDIAPAMSEPTLRELVQKLRTEPWATPEGIPVLPLHPPPEPAPGPAQDPGANPPKVDEPQISILERHETKFPLGGVSPANEAGNSVEKAAKDPEKPPRTETPKP
jgi:hypothetical protein